MRPVLRIESERDGVLLINGVFCGPIGEGQTYPASRDTEIYLQVFPYGEEAPLTACLLLRGGRIETLTPQKSAYALMWPGGVMQVELRGREREEGREASEEKREEATLYEKQPKDESRDNVLQSVLTRMLAGKQAGDAQLAQYEAAVPLIAGRTETAIWANAQAGLLRREKENVAAVDTALARVEEDGRITRLEIRRT